MTYFNSPTTRSVPSQVTGNSPGTYTPTLRDCMMCSQQGPLRLIVKYWLSTLAEIAEGGTCMWVSVSPGSARFTSSGTNLEEQTFTSWAVLDIKSASPTGE